LIAKIADDSVDSAIGGGKARFVALGASILFMAFVKGGEVHLKPGDQLEVSREVRGASRQNAKCFHHRDTEKP
jgi:hypothetical protein